MKSNKTSYLDHPLNKSPSKTTYTFSKSQRFPDLLPGSTTQFEEDSRNYYRDRKSSRERDSGGYYRQNSDYTDIANKRTNTSKQKRSKSKSISKGKKSIHNSKSPTRRVQFQQQYIQHRNSRSPGRNTRGSKQKRTRQQNQIINSRTGYYYPLGIEINKEGKYYVSNYQNVKSSKFSMMPRNITSASPQKTNDQSSILGPGSYDIRTKSPGKYITSDNRNNLSHKFSKSPRKLDGEEVSQVNANFGPGMYNTFSQFGPYK